MAVLGVVRRVAGSAPAAALVDLLERLVPPRSDTLAALTFHRVAPDGPEVTPGLLSATPEGFAALIDAIARRHTVIPVDDVVARAGGGPALPRRALVLTFDDAYADFGEHAWPALRARSLPATLFVPTAYPDRAGRSFWWDRLYAALRSTSRAGVGVPGGSRSLPLGTATERAAAYRTLRSALKALAHEELLATVDRVVGELDGPSAAEELDGPSLAGELDGTPAAGLPAVLGWDALRDIAAGGVALAPHTRTHPLLPRLDPSLVAGELRGSREDLARETGVDRPVFAYPSGAASAAVVAAVAATGFRVAFTTARGVNDLGRVDSGERSWLLLRRVNVSVRAPSAAVRAQLLR